MSFIAVNALDEIRAFSVTDDIVLGTGERLVEIPRKQLPDQMRCCKFVDGAVIIDAALKQAESEKIQNERLVGDKMNSLLRDQAIAELKSEGRLPPNYQD